MRLTDRLRNATLGLALVAAMSGCATTERRAERELNPTLYETKNLEMPGEDRSGDSYSAETLPYIQVDDLEIGGKRPYFSIGDRLSEMKENSDK